MCLNRSTVATHSDPMPTSVVGPNPQRDEGSALGAHLDFASAADACAVAALEGHLLGVGHAHDASQPRLGVLSRSLIGMPSAVVNMLADAGEGLLRGGLQSLQLRIREALQGGVHQAAHVRRSAVDAERQVIELVLRTVSDESGEGLILLFDG